MSASVDYEQLKSQILAQINIVRQHPTSYIPLLEEHMKYFKGDILYRPREIPIQTSEGVAAYEEAIQFLKKVKPLEALNYDERLSKACEDHVKDIGPKGLLTHDGTDGKTMSDRVEDYAEWDTCCGENIDVGSKTAQDVIISLIVDDGVPDRGHRKNMFKSEFAFVGMASGPHSEYGIMTVINYVGGLRGLGKPFYDYNNFKYQYPEEITKGFTRSLIKEEEKKPKIKTPFQVNDEDAPDETVSVKISKKTKYHEGRKLTITKKYYKLEDGTEQIVELEEF
jgi:uncharacterized protein YkwD